MTRSSTHEVTELLIAWGNGDEAALEQLAPLIHAELYRLAKGYMSRERTDHTLQTSALINEAYIRLIDWKTARFTNRAHFYGVAAQLMRRILVDVARSRPKVNGGFPAQHVELDDACNIAMEPDADLLALDEALKELAKFDPRKSQIVEMRFFGGLSVEEIAEVLQIAPVTVTREWNKARAWLFQAVNRADPQPD